MKANFKVAKTSSMETKDSSEPMHEKTSVSKEEFEEIVSKAGAAGSFMIFRSEKKEDELGIDEL